jgi:hypothetical protein
MYLLEKISLVITIINIVIILISKNVSDGFVLWFFISALPFANYLANAFLGGRPESVS